MAMFRGFFGVSTIVVIVTCIVLQPSFPTSLLRLPSRLKGLIARTSRENPQQFIFRISPRGILQSRQKEIMFHKAMEIKGLKETETGTELNKVTITGEINSLTT
ncbi:uncharacterized protein [Euwallacea fornicatus]|uniref:uncharacterized protein n=1 Tax=Euwallacea fornicatus TaxID=995702 RepID=UPI00338F8D6A